MAHYTKNSVLRVETEDQRTDALHVLRSTYREEKRWVHDERAVFPAEDLDNVDISWFMVYNGSCAAGVLRVMYDPPILTYREYDLQLLRTDLDVEKFVKENRIAEVGRFAVLPHCRRNIAIVCLLMKAAAEETLRKGYTHYITDVFEGEANSPYNFHTRVIGFSPVAYHNSGEMICPNRRITLVVNIRDSLRAMRKEGNRLYAMLTAGGEDWLQQELMV